MIRVAPVYSLVTLCIVTFCANGLLADNRNSSVSFDVQPMAPATPYASNSIPTTLPNSRLVSVQLKISSLVDPKFQGEVDEFVFRIESRRQELQVADYFPKTEMTTSIEGNVSVGSSYHQRREAQIRGAGGYPGAGWADGYARYEDQSDRQIYYQEKPALELLTAAGTLSRRTGVYFKLKRTSQTVLEGDRPFHMIFEVPASWRGDLLEVTTEAFALQGSKTKSIQHSKFMVAIYQEGDVTASQVAMGYVQMEQRLRQTANQYAREINKRSHPTAFHRLGAAFDVVQPEIPAEWLTETLFARVNPYPTGNYNRLPVDVRVIMLDYLDQKQAMEVLAIGKPVSTRG